MFVGHYGVGFAVKRADRTIPLWVLFIAVQFLDVLWAPCVLLGIEKVRIVPGITKTNPLDLYYLPYTHSLVAAVVWSCVGAILFQLLAHPISKKANVLVGCAVFSHWILDFLVHRPDLPLYDNSAKVGLGLWNYPVVALGLEAALLFGGMWLCLRGRFVRSLGTVVFGILMLGTQVWVFFGPPPSSDHAAAGTALLAYVAFAASIWWLQDRAAGNPALRRDSNAK
jgi:membrane-bound metal-dependent hydrolase YbcI (DUF457 family)